MYGIVFKTINSKYFKTISKQSAKLIDHPPKQQISHKDFAFLKNNNHQFQNKFNLINHNPISKIHASQQLLNFQMEKFLHAFQFQKEELSTKQTEQSAISQQKIFQINMNNVECTQFEANNPSEDRYLCKQLKSINAICLNVFDGHGGSSLSQYCSKKINLLIDQFLQKRITQNANQNKIQDIIKEAIKWAYKQIESQFYQILENQFKTGNKDILKIGSCGLTVVIFQNKIIIANCGDSQSIVVTQDPEGLLCFKGNQILSVNNPKEIQRIQQKFKNVDKQVFTKTKHNKAYLKGFLQPTKTLGDYYLKQEKYFNKVSGQNGSFKGPYLDCQPQFNNLQIKQNFKYLIIASDGLWDFVTKKQVLEIIKNYQDNKINQSQSYSLQDLNKTYIGKFKKESSQNLTQMLKKFVLQKCAKKKGMSVQQLQAIPPGQRRNYCDDLSIIIVNFKDNNLDIQ